MLKINALGGSSRYKGVSKSSRLGGFMAGISYQGRGINLGHFKNEMDAALAYNEAAKKIFGNFAHTSPMPPGFHPEKAGEDVWGIIGRGLHGLGQSDRRVY